MREFERALDFLGNHLKIAQTHTNTLRKLYDNLLKAKD